MVNPVSSGSGNGFFGDKEIQPGPPLPLNNPFVQGLKTLFPSTPIGELQQYAYKFQQNMFQWVGNEISRDLQRARKAARKLKEALDGND